MVNSESFDADVDRNEKAEFTPPNNSAESAQSLICIKAISVNLCENDFTTQTADSLPVSQAIEPTATKTDYKCNNMSEITNNCGGIDHNGKQTISLENTKKTGIYCSLPLEKLRDVLFIKNTIKDMCLYCDRHFVTSGLKQKHVERCHSLKYNRRLSARRTTQQSVRCMFCDKLNNVDCNLRTLFEHLVSVHSNKYFGCLDCEMRFQNLHLLEKHRIKIHGRIKTKEMIHDAADDTLKPAEKTLTVTLEPLVFNDSTKPYNIKKNKKMSVLSKKSGIKRCLPIITRPHTKIYKKKLVKNESNDILAPNSYSSEFSSKFKKITDHSIDNLKINTLTFDDVFDKTFFNKVKCNIQENLLHHIDGKLFKNHESENRILTFQKTTQHVEELHQIAPRGLTPIQSLVTPHFDYFESQIEYGLKPALNDEIHYKYFTRLKYQEIIAQNRKERDLSKLDMSTQMDVKTRQQNVMRERLTDKEILDYTNSDEYKLTVQINELNQILDKRGPLEDLKEEILRKVALEKFNNDSSTEANVESYLDVTIILDDLIDNVFSSSTEKTLTNTNPQLPEDIAMSFNLLRVTNTVFDNRNETNNGIVELSGEWARSKIYICAACGVKELTAKLLVEHKNLFHENVWCQHYEFVGNQGELYRHLSIPSLGKVGAIEEENKTIDLFKRSDSRVCTKCDKQFNCLGDLHRHILECGGDWSWALARKRTKYRPYGARQRRKKRLLIYLQSLRNRKKDESSEKRKYKKKFNGPRSKPSDAETIQRMLANLPAKRIRKISPIVKDGLKKSTKNKKDLKVKPANKLIAQSKAAIKNKILVKSVCNRARRLLRSNSGNYFDNAISLIKSSKRKRENKVKPIVRRHSLRNMNKILESVSLDAPTENKTSENKKIDQVRRNSQPNIKLTPSISKKLNKPDADLSKLKNSTSISNEKVVRKNKNISTKEMAAKPVKKKLITVPASRFKNKGMRIKLRRKATKKTTITKLVQVDGSSQNVSSARNKSISDHKSITLSTAPSNTKQPLHENKECQDVADFSENKSENNVIMTDVKPNLAMEKSETPAPFFKGKIKKQRGLNDCIAMLASKLKINNSLLENSSIFNLTFQNDIVDKHNVLSDNIIQLDAAGPILAQNKINCEEEKCEIKIVPQPSNNVNNVELPIVGNENVNQVQCNKLKKTDIKKGRKKKIDSGISQWPVYTTSSTSNIVEPDTNVKLDNVVETNDNCDINLDNLNDTNLVSNSKLGIEGTKLSKKWHKKITKLKTTSKHRRLKNTTNVTRVSYGVKNITELNKTKLKYRKQSKLVKTNDVKNLDGIVNEVPKTKQLKSETTKKVIKRNNKNSKAVELNNKSDISKLNLNFVKETYNLEHSNNDEHQNLEITSKEINNMDISILTSTAKVTTLEKTTISPISIKKLLILNGTKKNRQLKNIIDFDGDEFTNKRKAKVKNVNLKPPRKKTTISQVAIDIDNKVSIVKDVIKHNSEAIEIKLCNSDCKDNNLENTTNFKQPIINNEVDNPLAPNTLPHVINVTNEVLLTNERQLHNMTNTEVHIEPKPVIQKRKKINHRKVKRRSFSSDNNEWQTTNYRNNAETVNILTTDELSNSGKENISTNKKIRRKKLCKLIKSETYNKVELIDSINKSKGNKCEFDSEDEVPLALFLKRAVDPFSKYLVTINEVIRKSAEITENEVVSNCLVRCLKKVRKRLKGKTSKLKNLALQNNHLAVPTLTQLDSIHKSIELTEEITLKEQPILVIPKVKKARRKRKPKLQKINSDGVLNSTPQSELESIKLIDQNLKTSITLDVNQEVTTQINNRDKIWPPSQLTDLPIHSETLMELESTNCVKNDDVAMENEEHKLGLPLIKKRVRRKYKTKLKTISEEVKLSESITENSIPLPEVETTESILRAHLTKHNVVQIKKQRRKKQTTKMKTIIDDSLHLEINDADNILEKAQVKYDIETTNTLQLIPAPIKKRQRKKQFHNDSLHLQINDAGNILEKAEVKYDIDTTNTPQLIPAPIKKRQKKKQMTKLQAYVASTLPSKLSEPLPENFIQSSELETTTIANIGPIIETESIQVATLQVKKRRRKQKPKLDTIAPLELSGHLFDLAAQSKVKGMDDLVGCITENKALKTDSTQLKKTKRKYKRRVKQVVEDLLSGLNKDLNSAESIMSSDKDVVLDSVQPNKRLKNNTVLLDNSLSLELNTLVPINDALVDASNGAKINKKRVRKIKIGHIKKQRRKKQTVEPVDALEDVPLSKLISICTPPPQLEGINGNMQNINMTKRRLKESTPEVKQPIKRKQELQLPSLENTKVVDTKFLPLKANDNVACSDANSAPEVEPADNLIINSCPSDEAELPSFCTNTLQDTETYLNSGSSSLSASYTDTIFRMNSSDEIDIKLMQEETTADILTSETNRISQTKAPKIRKMKKRKSFKFTRKTSQVVVSNVTIICDICNKTFKRSENFLKHKRTLKHIAKLSELEALEAAEKLTNMDVSNVTPPLLAVTQPPLTISPPPTAVSPPPLTTTPPLATLPLLDISPPQLAISPPPIAVSPTSPLQLVDIISDMLIKPVDNLINLQPRCKSLGERKSFDSFPNDNNFIEDTAADVIVEKQISLLENMIEDNRINFHCSPENDYPSSYSPEPEISFTHNANIITNFIKPILEDSLVKTTQYEEISDDSNSSQFRYEEQKSRKALNRDEELFLECCSLLKSSSDNMSDICRKSMNPPRQFLNTFALRPVDECDWLEHKQLPRMSHNYCTSNPNPINLSLNMNGFLEKNNGPYFQPPIFEDISTESETSSVSNNYFDQFNDDSHINEHYLDERSITVNSPVSPNVESAVIPDEYIEPQEEVDEEARIIENDAALSNPEERISSPCSLPDSTIQVSSHENLTPLDLSNDKPVPSEINNTPKDESKKIPTKGALKVFEGLRVSIPIESINLVNILKYSPIAKHYDKEASVSEIPSTINVLTKEVLQIDSEVDNTKSKMNKIIKNKSDKLDLKKSMIHTFGNKLGLKIKKRRVVKKIQKVEHIKKSYDVYDFEETQDNIDIFDKSTTSIPVYHAFTNKLKPLKKLTSNTNITKKKCMIMERIFKNALKPKLGDDIKNIPSIQHDELVKSYVRDCQKQEMYMNKQSKLTEDEMNCLFDKLLGEEKVESNFDAISERSGDSKFNKSVRSKKRRSNSVNSSDEEFNIKKPPKCKKGETSETINMEQELEECIGVASRKSQRKCTSGKQNVLTEYWSSDDSNLIESILPPTPIAEKIIEPIVIPIPQIMEISTVEQKEPLAVRRQKRTTVDTLYYWSSSSEDELHEVVEVKELREEQFEQDDRPLQHGWIVGDSPKKLVTMLAQAKGKKIVDSHYVKKTKKKRTSL